MGRLVPANTCTGAPGLGRSAEARTAVRADPIAQRHMNACAAIASYDPRPYTVEPPLTTTVDDTMPDPAGKAVIGSPFRTTGLKPVRKDNRVPR